jgi:DNA invertase Pin-like site-specific DNA recombinase
MAIIGYARVTVSQDAGFEAQLRDLRAAGVTKVFQERVSSVAYRAQLEAAIDYCREGDGDVLIVTKLDRLCRSIRDLCAIIDRLKAKGASLKILNLGFDLNSPTGKMTLGILGNVAEFEREILLERQREGILKAKADGKYRGQPAHARAKAPKVLKLIADGMAKEAVAKELKMSLRSVYRCLHDARGNASPAPVASKRLAP